LHSEELHILYSSTNIIRQIKLRRMRRKGQVACMGQETKVIRVLVGKPEGRDHPEDHSIDGRMGSSLLGSEPGPLLWGTGD
jgi:hypothetical protein